VQKTHESGRYTQTGAENAVNGCEAAEFVQKTHVGRRQTQKTDEQKGSVSSGNSYVKWYPAKKDT